MWIDISKGSDVETSPGENASEMVLAEEIPPEQPVVQEKASEITESLIRLLGARHSLREKS